MLLVRLVPRVLLVLLVLRVRLVLRVPLFGGLRLLILQEFRVMFGLMPIICICVVAGTSHCLASCLKQDGEYGEGYYYCE
jgi:hypothetical protein